MSRDQRMILVLFLILLSSGCFGTSPNGWTDIVMGVCLAVAFGVYSAGEEDGDEREGEER